MSSRPTRAPTTKTLPRPTTPRTQLGSRKSTLVAASAKASSRAFRLAEPTRLELGWRASPTANGLAPSGAGPLWFWQPRRQDGDHELDCGIGQRASIGPICGPHRNSLHKSPQQVCAAETPRAAIPVKTNVAGADTTRKTAGTTHPSQLPFRPLRPVLPRFADRKKRPYSRRKSLSTGRV